MGIGVKLRLSYANALDLRYHTDKKIVGKIYN